MIGLGLLIAILSALTAVFLQTNKPAAAEACLLGAGFSTLPIGLLLLIVVKMATKQIKKDMTDVVQPVNKNLELSAEFLVRGCEDHHASSETDGVCTTSPPEQPVSPVATADVGLSGKEYLMFSLLFLVLPVICALVSGTLYYAWRKQSPKRADQINKLGFLIFGLQMVLYFFVGYLGQSK